LRDLGGIELHTCNMATTGNATKTVFMLEAIWMMGNFGIVA